MSNVSGWLPNLLGPVKLQDEGTDATARPAINFTGAGVTVTDDPTNDRVNVTIPGGGGGSTPTGTGFRHVTGGTEDAASKLVVNADVDAAAAIALSKIVNPTGTGLVKATSGAIDAATSKLVNADVDAAAAIAGTKVSPDFGSQDVVTTGKVTAAKLGLGAPNNQSGTGTLSDLSLGGKRVQRFTNVVGPTVNSFDATGVSEGELLVVYAAAANILLKHETGGTAANRMTLGSSVDATLTQGSFAFFIYLDDGSGNLRWRECSASAI